MKRSQWFVLGIGLILIGIIMGGLSGMIDCNALQKESLDLVEESINAKLDVVTIQGLMASSNAWAISCFDTYHFKNII
ncbi:hypothetical protein LCGC14_1701150 [marine sediment metagenome]|uniref:Uncharacterized protein n=1 Tax=marine sediment metagenome TaxID=412755 RepID=A0A0F9I5J2_9ZZZZ